jgi:hypothetical protein
MHSFDPLCVPSDLPGVNPTTLNGILLYCRLMTKWSGLGDSTELSRMGLSQAAPTREVGAFTLSPRAAEAAEETTPGAGAGAPAARHLTKEAMRAAEAPARAAGTTGGEAVATTSVEPPRKRKRGFSTPR